MRRISSTEARKDFSDIVNRAHYKEEITVITKQGRDLAAVVPMRIVETSQDSQPEKKPTRSVTRHSDRL
jgi:prevent-host-death family protein